VSVYFVLLKLRYNSSYRGGYFGNLTDFGEGYVMEVASFMGRQTLDDILILDVIEETKDGWMLPCFLLCP